MLRARSLSIYGLSLLCALLFVLQFESWPGAFVLKMEVQPGEDTSLTLLFDQGAGYREQDSIVVRLPGIRDFTPVSFHIPVAEIHNLSLLVYSASPSLRLRNVRLEMLGRRSLVFGADSIRPGKTTTLTGNGNVVEITGPRNEKDIGFTLSSLLRETRTCRRLRSGIFFGLCTGILALILLLPNRDKRVLERPGGTERLLCNTTVILLVCVYLVASIAKLNGSATALWRIYADRRAANAGLILGTPKAIRSDEWVGQTPWILSQIASDFPLTNLGVGEEMMPLLNNLPARHWTMFFRPQMWAFFVADLERGFAFYWNFKWFGFLLGAFLFLRTVARGNSLIGLFGALLLFFSPFVQWWFSTPTAMPEMIGAFFFALWSLVVIARAQKRWEIAGGAIVLVQSVAQFVFCAYPRFQIPLIYLWFFVVAAVWIARRNRLLYAPLARFRAYSLAIAIILSALVMVAWYQQVADAIHRVSALAYPGKMFSTGGGFPWQRLFMPFLEFAMTDEHYPQDQTNVCEAAGFLFFAPFVIVAAVSQGVRRRFDPIIIGSLAFIGLALGFMLFGFPAPVAKWTGLRLVYPPRLALAVGIASIIGLCRCLVTAEREQYLTRATRLLLLLILAAIGFAIFQSANRKLAGFVDARGLIVTSLYFAAVFALLWWRQMAVAAVLVLVPTIYSTGLANPIGRGLPGFLESDTFNWLLEAKRQRPEAKWLVIGTSSGRTTFLPQFVKATGADTFGGYRCEADQRMVRALDPSGKYSDVYNRYAEIQILPASKPEPSFELTWVNHYNVLLPLKPEILHRLGVTYVLEVDLPSAEAAIDGYSVIGERNGLRLLEAKPQP